MAFDELTKRPPHRVAAGLLTLRVASHTVGDNVEAGGLGRAALVEAVIELGNEVLVVLAHAPNVGCRARDLAQRPLLNSLHPC